MKIEIQHIPSQGLTLTYRKKAREFETIAEISAAGECEFTAPVDIVLEVLPERDFFRVRGRLDTAVRLTCSRCADLFDMPLQNRFTVRYSNKIPTDVHRGDDDPIELTAERIGVNFFDGEEIDFTAAVQEQLVLALPYKPLCRESCKGICAGCGVDLNRESCRCSASDDAGPFAVLKKLIET